MSAFSPNDLFHINIFTPKLGRLDDFLAVQLDGVQRLGEIPGLNASRIYRAEDGLRAVVVAGFDSIEAHQAFQANPAFQTQRAKLLPLLETTQPGFFRLVHERAFA